MLKSFFMGRKPADEVDHELERAMEAIHDRMERMLAADANRRERRFSTIESIPSYYR